MAPAAPIDFSGQKGSSKFSLSKMTGKSRKYSKVNATTGFVPDFRHAVETIGESEGLGSSGRVDTDGSYAPNKNKYLSLNSACGQDSFNVPFQVLPLSKLEFSERRELKRKLKRELDEVRKFQKKIAGLSLNPHALSSVSEGQKRPRPESHHGTVEALVPHSNKRPAPSSGSGNGNKTKKSVSGRLESVKADERVTPSFATMAKQCQSLLNRLLTHKFGNVFDKPVDVVKWNIPDYFTIIKHPMDLGTVKRKLISGEYSSLMDFAADVRLTFSNAMTYNPPTNEVHVMADALSKYFETRWKPVEKKILAVDGMPLPSETSRLTTTHVETEIVEQIPPMKKKKTMPNETEIVDQIPPMKKTKTMPNETEIVEQIPPMKKTKTMPNETYVRPEPIRRIMTVEEKQKLSSELEALVSELPETIIDFLKEQSTNAGETVDDEIEIDIDAMKDETLFKLRKLIDDFMLERRKSQAIDGTCNEPDEEDIDIVGGNDPPLSSYPPVEIDIDGTNRDSKCSSPSSSSSESGSSTSDSGSSSESESEIANASDPLNLIKERVSRDPFLDEMKGDHGDSETVMDSANAVSQVEQCLQTNPVIDEPQTCEDGENTPSKRQVSPDKLYRAALLKSRFADTILKAREKALEKDPEKLRMEREKLVRQQKEEKARLLADAKVAEEARRKAEAKAAAEAKRKRELEREAARFALQKMEKTVDINGSSQFLDDLEMLSGVQDEHLTSYAEESSPDCPPNGLGSFKLQGSSNPLEQLGLYMKVDDEDEEEEPHQNEANDVEEGEID